MECSACEKDLPDSAQSSACCDIGCKFPFSITYAEKSVPSWNESALLLQSHGLVPKDAAAIFC